MSAPLTTQIADRIAERIAQGEWLPGDRLPDHPQLARQYSVSKATITSTVQILRTRGLVVTRVGSGTFVRPPKPPRIALPAPPRQESGMVIDRRDVEAVSWVRRYFASEAGTQVTRIRELVEYGQDQHAVHDSYVPLDYQGDRPRTSLTDGWDVARVWLPAPDEARLLNIAEEVPVIALLNRYDTGCTVRLFGGDAVELS